MVARLLLRLIVRRGRRVIVGAQNRRPQTGKDEMEIKCLRSNEEAGAFWINKLHEAAAYLRRKADMSSSVVSGRGPF